MLNIKNEYGEIRTVNELIEHLVLLKLRDIKGIVGNKKNVFKELNDQPSHEFMEKEENQNTKDKKIEIKIETKEESILIDLFIFIKYGIRIPDLAWDIQNKIKEEITREFEIDNAEINIYIQGIQFPKKSIRNKELILSDLSIQII